MHPHPRPLPTALRAGGGELNQLDLLHTSQSWGGLGPHPSTLPMERIAASMRLVSASQNCANSG
jgi:hypothetical protein